MGVFAVPVILFGGMVEKNGLEWPDKEGAA